MHRHWWLVWVKVGVLALVLFLGFLFCLRKVNALVAPYLIHDPQPTQSTSESGSSGEGGDIISKVTDLMSKVFKADVDLENLIFDYANEYAHNMIDQSYAERTVEDSLR